MHGKVGFLKSSACKLKLVQKNIDCGLANIHAACTKETQRTEN
jgi:hypothetical protein